MGAEGDPELALRRSIDEGMHPNNRGQHVNYLEIYERDVVAEEMQPVLRYASIAVSVKPTLTAVDPVLFLIVVAGLPGLNV